MAEEIKAKEAPKRKVMLTGDRPTGRLHVGHYVGSLKRRVELQNSGEYDDIYIMIADAQALTDNADNPEKVRQNIIEVALDYMSCGILRSNLRFSSVGLRQASRWDSLPIPLVRQQISLLLTQPPCR